MLKRRTRLGVVSLVSVLGAVSSLMVALVLASPAGAVTHSSSHRVVAAAHVSAPAPTGRVCAVRATSFVRHGRTNTVTASATRCYSSYRSYLTARREAPLTNVNVGFGCESQGFAGTCWYFAVASPGCTSTKNWVWNVLGVMYNDMQSWEPLNSCSSGVVYYLTYQTGSHIDCFQPFGCGSLQAINNHDESLLARH